MAIKRSTKSRGTSSHKPASAPLRHVELRQPQRMTPGEQYVGWSCKKCGALIAIAATTLEDNANFEDQLTAIKCPHCGDEDLYRWSARSEQAYSLRNA